MEYPVFYSWQNDLPKKCNRTFIREALDEAVRNVKAEDKVEDSPRVDSGMEGIAGSPEVASIMCRPGIAPSASSSSIGPLLFIPEFAARLGAASRRRR